MEGALLRALGKIFKSRLSLTGAGRTDTGVHALGQVVNFKSDLHIPTVNLKLAINSCLPRAIRVLDVNMVPAIFNARRSAKSREYRYLFTQHEVPVYFDDVVAQVPFVPDLRFFSDIADILKGEHDFSNFKCQGSSDVLTMKTIYEIGMEQRPIEDIFNRGFAFNCYSFRIVADSFLYRMVRNILGAMFQVLRGTRTIDEFRLLLTDVRHKAFNYTLAPAKGLCLVKVNY